MIYSEMCQRLLSPGEPMAAFTWLHPGTRL